MTEEQRRRKAEYMRLYTRQHSEIINARRRARGQERKVELAEQKRVRREQKHEHILVLERASFHRTKERKKPVAKAWRELNQESIRMRTRQWNLENSESQRLKKVSRRYGLSAEDYQALLVEQDGLCAVCRKQETQRDRRSGRIRRLAVDHVHETGAVRGLLCCACNAAIGQFDDDCARLAAAIAYLDSHKERQLKLVVNGPPA